VNESLSLTDAMLHTAIESRLSAPPSLPADGACWLVGTGATGEWAGRDNSLACRQAGSWLFVAPLDGMKVLDRSTGQTLICLGGWNNPSPPSEPIGGSVVDSEARAAILELVAALRAATILPST